MNLDHRAVSMNPAIPLPGHFAKQKDVNKNVLSLEQAEAFPSFNLPKKDKSGQAWSFLFLSSFHSLSLLFSLSLRPLWIRRLSSSFVASPQDTTMRKSLLQTFQGTRTHLCPPSVFLSVSLSFSRSFFSHSPKHLPSDKRNSSHEGNLHIPLWRIQASHTERSPVSDSSPHEGKEHRRRTPQDRLTSLGGALLTEEKRSRIHRSMSFKDRKRNSVEFDQRTPPPSAERSQRIRSDDSASRESGVHLEIKFPKRVDPPPQKEPSSVHMSMAAKGLSLTPPGDISAPKEAPPKRRKHKRSHGNSSACYSLRSIGTIIHLCDAFLGHLRFLFFPSL